MLECDYIVKQIDGEYAHLQNLDGSEEISWLQEPCCRMGSQRERSCTTSCYSMRLYSKQSWRRA